MPTFLEIQNRFLALVDEAAIDSTHKSHINYSIKDILNEYPFSWDLASSDLTLATGSADLPSTYNPKWRIYDARIVVSSTGDDYIFQEIDVKDRDEYSATEYVYWITWDATSEVHVFNTPTQTGTVVIKYYILPVDLSADGDVCIVPDAEAVAMLAGSKWFLGEDQDGQLVSMYEGQAKQRIKAMYTQDMNFGPVQSESSKIANEESLTTKGI